MFMKLAISILAVLGACAVVAAAWAGAVYHVGDSIDLKVTGYEEELDGIYRIGPDSMLVIPFIGPIRAAGLDVPTLRSQLTEKIWQYYVNRPYVVIKPLHTVTVLGEVNAPGKYSIEGGERLSGLIAMAGGTRSNARLNNARVTRGDTLFKQNLKNALENGDTMEDIGVMSGDVIYVPGSSWFSSFRNWAIVLSTVSTSFLLYDRATR